MKDFINFEIQENDAKRLDKVVRKLLLHLPLSKIYAMIRSGEIRVNGKPKKQNYILQSGDVLQIRKSVYGEQQRTVHSDAQTKVVLSTKHKKTIAKDSLLYKDKDFLVLAKKHGELVHGKNSLDEIVKGNSQVHSFSFKCGALHRLDRGTTGILVFSQSLIGAQTFSQALQSGKIIRKYFALITGHFHEKKKIDISIGGKSAITIIKPLTVFKKVNTSFVEIEIITGRKHQIRIHCANIGFPLLGDIQFADCSDTQAKKNYEQKDNYFLHFYKMETKEKILELPSTLICPLPIRFQKKLIQLRELEKNENNNTM
ncbi:MAG: RluA family pseudouridine synthase [Spirochaetaceae bacterium]|nr:RluA family pseudouridine synthase [Spirochaetaceae bacterium]